MKITNEVIDKQYCRIIQRCEDEHTDRHSKRFYELYDSLYNQVKGVKRFIDLDIMDFGLQAEEEGFREGFKEGVMYALKELFFELADEDDGNKEEEIEQEIKEEPKQAASDEFINTRQIARMFETQNFRIVKRIESRILPILSPNSSAKFIKYDWRTANGRTCTCYKMNKEAGMMFLRTFEKGKDTYTGIGDGYTKLEEYMNR